MSAQRRVILLQATGVAALTILAYLLFLRETDTGDLSRIVVRGGGSQGGASAPVKSGHESGHGAAGARSDSKSPGGDAAGAAEISSVPSIVAHTRQGAQPGSPAADQYGGTVDLLRTRVSARPR